MLNHSVRNRRSMIGKNGFSRPVSEFRGGFWITTEELGFYAPKKREGISTEAKSSVSL